MLFSLLAPQKDENEPEFGIPDGWVSLKGRGDFPHSGSLALSTASGSSKSSEAPFNLKWI